MIEPKQIPEIEFIWFHHTTCGVCLLLIGWTIFLSLKTTFAGISCSFCSGSFNYPAESLEVLTEFIFESSIVETNSLFFLNKITCKKSLRYLFKLGLASRNFCKNCRSFRYATLLSFIYLLDNLIWDKILFEYWNVYSCWTLD